MRSTQKFQSSKDKESTPLASGQSSHRPALQPRPPVPSPRQYALFTASQPFPVASLASQDSQRPKSEKQPVGEYESGDNEATFDTPVASPLDSKMNLEKLKEAVQSIHGAKFKPTSPTTNPAKSSMRKTLVMASVEQQAMSPSLEAAFNSPLATGAQTTSSQSTESTGSVSTIRGTAASTPGQVPIRTPSYPFPYVPSRVSSGLNFPSHQPFTTLSPTMSYMDVSTKVHARDKYSVSTQSTPVAGPSYFGPSGSEHVFAPDSVGFNGPSLYDVVLHLNADPNLSAWWTTLTSVLREHYKVDRASLALPADATDIENVPWGQKACYNVNGLQNQSSAERSTNRSVSVSSETSKSSSSRRSELPDESPSNPNTRFGLTRPGIETRHSFAGYEHDQSAYANEPARAPMASVRPSAPRRVTMQTAPSLRRNSLSEAQRSPERPTPIYERLSEEHILQSGDVDEGLLNEDIYAMILPTLKALDREKDALLDPSGVNRVLERGRLVTLTRDYSIDGERKQSVVGGTLDPHATLRKVKEEPMLEYAGASLGSKATVPGFSRQRIGGNAPIFHKAPFGQNANDQRPGNDDSLYYEDYEQFPTSPWSQSPAPSPAIQKDPEMNPFFVAGNLDEDSFTPTPTHEDYSRFGQVEAIGVDKASTIIHIPLIHPLLSRPWVSSSDDENSPSSQHSKSGIKHGENSSTTNRKRPIAILSIQASDVPYPQTMLHSLRSLAPHLATSFQTSLQNTTLQERIAGAIYRQRHSGRTGSMIPFPSSGLDLGLGFETLLQFDPDDGRSSTVDSLASPSEYSGRSRHSPPGSVACTPGLDPLVHMTTGRLPTSTTPGLNPGSEPTENYFEAKKRTTLSRSRSGGPLTQSQIAAQRAPSADHRAALRKIEHETSPVGKDLHGTQARRGDSRKTRVKDEKSSPAEASPLRRRAPNTRADGEESRHTVLHSHGADFSASFQSLPVAAVPRTSGTAHHTRNSSLSDVFDMPPPSERLLRTIIDSLPVQIFTATPSTGRVTWVNSKFLAYRGQTPKQVIEDPWGTIHPADLDEYTNDWHRSLYTGHQFQHKIRLRRFDDNYRWYYVRAAPLRDKLQNIVHWVGTMIDLHDQHIAELNAARQQETAASEAKYRALANSSPQIVFAATRVKGITFCNTQWVGYSGQTEEQAKGTGFMEHVYPDDLIKCQLPFYDAAGNSSTTAPLTEAPKPRRNESVTSSESSSASVDSQSTATVVNTVSASLASTKLSELASAGILRVSKDSTGRPSYSTEVRLRMQSGEYRWHLVRVLLAEPLIQTSVEEQTWYGTCTDINDHKELEQTLKETMDAKSRFLSNMSHEIRTPLNGISGMANFLIDSNLTPEQMDQVNVIRASTEGLRDLINDILDLSKVEAGMITLNMDWLRIRSVIEEVNDLTSSLATDKGIELNYLVEDTVPSMVKGDKFRLRQVLLNVIGNAIKFTQEGEVFIHCTLAPVSRSNPSTGSVILQMDVIDTGRGFSEKEAERLFKRFSQIDGSSTRQHGGTGLGLVISMQLVELHGGSMSAKSTPGKGSTFTFTIKFGLPTDLDQPPEIPKGDPARIDKSAVTEPPHPRRASMGLTSAPDSGIEEPKTMVDISLSPGFYAGIGPPARASPSILSSAGSDISAPTASLSSQSSRSSQSSYNAEPGTAVVIGSSVGKQIRSADPAVAQVQERITLQARAFSILVVCPLLWTKTATVGHLNSVLNHTVPHMVTSKDDISEARDMIGGPAALTFSHVVLVLQDVQLFSDMIQYTLQSTSSITSVVIISDMATRRKITSANPQLDFDQLASNRRVLFIQKPIKPSRLAIIFDPEKSRELSTDQNQQSAQQIALSQKRVFDEMTRRIGNKDIKVLLVEDNKINQMVMLKLLRRVSVAVETCLDGVQATDKVLSKPPDYFSIILLDLMMPNKDGYQTCIDIRAWEKRNNYPHIPIVALSANVLDDVWQKCKEAGFNSYLTKPVEFKELSDVMTAYLDPEDPSKPIQFMSKRPSTRSGGSFRR